jgi:hypothetical protein
MKSAYVIVQDSEVYISNCTKPMSSIFLNYASQWSLPPWSCKPMQSTPSIVQANAFYFINRASHWTLTSTRPVCPSRLPWSCKPMQSTPSIVQANALYFINCASHWILTFNTARLFKAYDRSFRLSNQSDHISERELLIFRAGHDQNSKLGQLSRDCKLPRPIPSSGIQVIGGLQELQCMLRRDFKFRYRLCRPAWR